MGGELYVRVCDELTATGDAVKAHLPTVLGGPSINPTPHPKQQHPYRFPHPSL